MAFIFMYDFGVLSINHVKIESQSDDALQKKKCEGHPFCGVTAGSQ